MSRPLIDQALTFGPDATTSGSTAYFPDVLRGQCLQYMVYIYFSSGAASQGKVQVQTAPAADSAATWANYGITIDWSAASTWKYAQFSGVFGALRLNIDTTVTSGTVSAWVVAQAL